MFYFFYFTDDSCCCMNYVDNILKKGSLNDAYQVNWSVPNHSIVVLIVFTLLEFNIFENSLIKYVCKSERQRVEILRYLRQFVV